MKIRKVIEQRVATTLSDSNAHLHSITGHFVGTSGIHTADYIDCDVLFPETLFIDWCAEHMAEDAREQRIRPGLWFDVVIGIGRMGELLAQKVTQKLGSGVVPIYAEKKNDGVILPRHCEKVLHQESQVQSAQVLVVDDVFTTGKTVSQLMQLVASYGARTVAISVLVNRNGSKTTLDGIPVIALLSEHLPSYPEERCPLCKDGSPIFTDVGHGADVRRDHEYWPDKRFAVFYS